MQLAILTLQLPDPLRCCGSFSLVLLVLGKLVTSLRLLERVDLVVQVLQFSLQLLDSVQVLGLAFLSILQLLAQRFVYVLQGVISFHKLVDSALVVVHLLHLRRR